MVNPFDNFGSNSESFFKLALGILNNLLDWFKLVFDLDKFSILNSFEYLLFLSFQVW